MDKLVKDLRENHDKYFARDMQAADVIEQLSKDLERSKEWEKFWEKEANEALKKFQTTVASMPRWIPVTERLPEKQGWCIACVFYRGIQWGDITTKGFTTVCPAYFFEGTFHKVSSEGEVTHWMPLPEPPKEGQGDV